MKELIFLTLILTGFCFSSCNNQKNSIVFPYSKLTADPSTQTPIHDGPDFKNNYAFITQPQNQNWNEWCKRITEFRDSLKEMFRSDSPYIPARFDMERSLTLGFDRIGYDIKLRPGEKIAVECNIKNHSPENVVYFGFFLKKNFEESAGNQIRQFSKVDSIVLSDTSRWVSYKKEMTVPVFNADTFAITPVMSIYNPKWGTAVKAMIKDIILKTPADRNRKNLLKMVEKQIAMDYSWKLPPELSWMDKNFVMDLVFMYDQDLWDYDNSVFTVDKYCEKRNREFGGIQSVIFWHNYPNIGIDEKSQFDMIYEMPGGLDGFRQLVSDFHRNNVKVFFSYNQWDRATRKSGKTHYEEIAEIVKHTKLDGIFLDTWSSTAGNNTPWFVNEPRPRERLVKDNLPVSVTSENRPAVRDIIGFNGLSSSWGQAMLNTTRSGFYSMSKPFNKIDLSLFKWLMPEHKQYFINRGTKDRNNDFSNAWINGQGLQLWENLFGTMNFYSAKDRQIMRRMNAIWKIYGDLYVSDNWKPFLHSSSKDVVVSKWIDNNQAIMNIVNQSDQQQTEVRIEAGNDGNKRYFDIWNGKELIPVSEGGKKYILVDIRDFGCIMETKQFDQPLKELLKLQEMENGKPTPVPADDPYFTELSLKFAKKPPQIITGSEIKVKTDLLKVKGGIKRFVTKHVWREGECYPDADAENNHDLRTVRGDTALWQSKATFIVHHHTDTLKDYSIMKRVVTNKEFEEFVKATGYEPGHPVNFLKHWGGVTCPEEIKDKPVVYVNLEDARAFASWAGMRLPTEWEWQLAAEVNKDKFRFNEVWEWNESERFDGYNHFVNLRGGCATWRLSGAYWYFPNTPNLQGPGGPQPYDSHCKYFILNDNIDRASTLGFRCLR